MTRTAAMARLARASASSSRPTASGGPSPRPPARLKGIVYVVNGTVARIRAVDPDGTWQRDDRGYADIPLTLPLTDVQAAEQFPTLGIRLGDHRPHVRGKLREYLPL